MHYRPSSHMLASYTHICIRATLILFIIINIPTDTDTSIVIISESATITAGSTGIIVCVARGYPVPSLTWSRGGTLLSNNSQSTIYEDQVVETQSGETFVQSILMICSLTQEDAAQYNCSASNNISSTSASLNLTVNRTYINTHKVITVIRWCLT